MKKIFILISLIFIFLNIAHAQSINECKTDIYFGNGVWNSPEQAEEGQEVLDLLIDLAIIDGDQKLKAKYGEVKLQYNWGQGIMMDVLETFYQLKEAGQVNDLDFFRVVFVLTGRNLPLTLSAGAYKALKEPLNKNYEEGNAYEMWEKYYHESFKLSHKVLLVSHSQGNLFANRVYEKIAPTKYQAYFANLQVASPASEIKAEKGDYVTGFVDPVINPIPGSMSSNADLDLPGGHKFVEAYLSSSDTLVKIITKTKQLLANLDTESSQWELDQELNKGTKDFKITLKHRFDTTITSMQDVEVYPFKPSAKLYHVTDNTGGNGWVKASCGGEEVFDSWSGQESDEAYLINNEEREKILDATNWLKFQVLRGATNDGVCKKGYFVQFAAVIYPEQSSSHTFEEGITVAGLYGITITSTRSHHGKYNPDKKGEFIWTHTSLSLGDIYSCGTEPPQIGCYNGIHFCSYLKNMPKVIHAESLWGHLN